MDGANIVPFEPERRRRPARETRAMETDPLVVIAVLLVGFFLGIYCGRVR